MPFKSSQIRACFAEAHRSGKSDKGCHKMAHDSPNYMRKNKRGSKRRR